MKRIGLILTTLLIVVNITIGTILSSFGWLNVLFSSLAIIINSVLLMLLWKDSIRDAFKISLSFVLGIMAIIEYIISIFMPAHYKDNYALITNILLLVFGVVIYLIVKKVSLINKNR